MRPYSSELMDRLLRKIAQMILIFSPSIFNWLLAIRRTYIVYYERHGFYPSLFFSVRFTEKIQWRKLFDLNPLYSILCDKIAVRDFIKQRGGPELLVPQLWSGGDPTQYLLMPSSHRILLRVPMRLNIRSSLKTKLCRMSRQFAIRRSLGLPGITVGHSMSPVTSTRRPHF